MNNYRETKTEKNVGRLPFAVEQRFLLSDEKWIVPAFPANGRWRSVPGEHSDCVIEGKQLLTNALEKDVPIASGQVPTTNPFPEEHIATDDDVFIEKVKA
jgi:hypothetical protein